MAITGRTYTSRRMAIVNALVDKLKEINGQGLFRSDVEDRVSPRLKFWDEIQEFPAIHLNAGSESRIYQASNYKERYLTVTVRVYVNEEDSADALEALLEDVETVLEDNCTLVYTDRDNATQHTHKTSIITIDTDEGVLDPMGIGEIVCEIMY